MFCLDGGFLEDVRFQLDKVNSQSAESSLHKINVITKSQKEGKGRVNKERYKLEGDVTQIDRISLPFPHEEMWALPHSLKV